MKQVRETKAGQSISAYVILDKKHRHVATVHAHRSDSGVCTVDVWHYDSTPLQQAKAGGYGYDKFTAALAGMTIDGHELFDHCGQNEQTRRMLKRYLKDAQTNPSFNQKIWNKKAGKIGARFANHNAIHASSLYMSDGLNRLKSFGYTIIKAI